MIYTIEYSKDADKTLPILAISPQTIVLSMTYTTIVFLC